jgi:hypothetical protein
MHDRLAMPDINGFPIASSWSVVYSLGKKRSVVASTFLE